LPGIEELIGTGPGVDLTNGHEFDFEFYFPEDSIPIAHHDDTIMHSNNNNSTDGIIIVNSYSQFQSPSNLPSELGFLFL